MASPPAGSGVNTAEPLKVYWQPGCTACLRMKEFLTRHGVEYTSVNVLADSEGLDELLQLAGRHVPIARRGDDFADGQVLADLARIAGIELGAAAMLPPRILARRAQGVFACARRLTLQIPEETLGTLLPNRPRTYAQLVAHIVQILEAFVDLVERGKRLEYEAYYQDVPADAASKAGLVAFVDGVQRRFDAWWQRQGRTQDFSATADVYYGEQSLHEFLERTVWHSSQHTRQLALVVETLGIVPDGPLTAAELAGLPLPEHVWDDTLVFNAALGASPQ